jgi:hypothetical protein
MRRGHDPALRRLTQAARCAVLVIGALAIAIIGGCSATPVRLDAAGAPVGGASVTVIDRGWHTDIALPAEALPAPVAAVGQGFPGVRFLVFGFGDHVYYMARDESFLGTLAAMFPGPGVILVTALRAPPADAFGADHVVTLHLSCLELRAVVGFLQHALATRSDGAMQRLGEGPYPGSVFYASSESYDLFHDCNRWTLAALGSGGLPADPDGVIFAGQVMKQARAIAAQQQQRRSSPDMTCAG